MGWHNLYKFIIVQQACLLKYSRNQYGINKQSQRVKIWMKRHSSLKNVHHFIFVGDINIKHVVENTHTMERMHTLTSILAGIIAGLFNTNLYSGIFTYLCLHLLMTVFVMGSIGDVSKFFLKKIDIVSGIGSGVPVFMCAWIIIFNIVYTLWIKVQKT